MAFMKPESNLLSLLNFGTLAINWSATLNYLGNLVFFFFLNFLRFCEFSFIFIRFLKNDI